MAVKVIPHSVSAWETRFHKEYASSGPVNVSQVINDAGVSTWNDTKTGDDNPNWRHQVRSGINATTNYSVVGRKKHILSGGGETVFTDSVGRTKVRGFKGHPQHLSWSGLLDPSALDSTTADQLARQRFVSKYRERRTAFQGGVFLGELRQTVKMIRRPAGALRDGIDRYYRAVKKRARQSRPHLRNRTIRDTWLEYSFGWRPLIRDVEDACKLATASSLAVYQVISATDRVDHSKVIQPGSHTVPSGFRVNYSIVTSGFSLVKYKGAIRAVNAPPSFPEQLGLSWSNFAPTIWELIPYSFLVDYFTNVGAVIEGISTGTISLAWGCRNVVKSYESKLVSLGFDHDVAQANVPNGGRYSGYATLAGPYQSRSTYNRSPVNSVSVGIRDLSFKLPGSKVKWLNVAALSRMRLY